MCQQSDPILITRVTGIGRMCSSTHRCLLFTDDVPKVSALSFRCSAYEARCEVSAEKNKQTKE